MQHHGTMQLETDRLILRKIKLDDATAAFNNWTNDSQVIKFLTWKKHETIQDTQDIIAKWIEAYSQSNFYLWAIVLKNISDEPIGAISVVKQDDKVSSLAIGYCIGSKWWRQGITSEAFSAVISYLFDTVKANRIESWHDPNNPNSGKVMQKCGLTYEGTFRQADYNNMGVVDASYYSILANEYYSKFARV